ncbi:hypothetical protein NUW54_g10388 [Trametes sanguinea]|uniref:Uncharacterized protein n=1 Tax=Trametes sanguinea TaxID=158606 RepID=A0ACC1P1N4_9APHY|nr:hypothetical protein NUW54_g10388 [Trametes sanguinea]
MMLGFGGKDASGMGHQGDVSMSAELEAYSTSAGKMGWRSRKMISDESARYLGAALDCARERRMTGTSPSYEPVPTDSQASPSATPLKVRSRLVTVRRVLLFAVTIVLVSLAAYKSEQWSAEKNTLDLESGLPSGNTEEDISQEAPHPSVSVNETDMSAGGKYSVGYSPHATNSFVNWGIYGRKFPPSLIPVDNLTYVRPVRACNRGGL